MDQQLELLTKLLAFYKGRYDNNTELETKFNNACEDLINTGDLKSAVYIKFCIENDVEPRIKPVKKSTPGSNYFSSGCGHSGYTRSSC